MPNLQTSITALTSKIVTKEQSSDKSVQAALQSLDDKVKEQDKQAASKIQPIVIPPVQTSDTSKG